mmetsp:Transcript_108147/g.304582  ORF Transcript_108147/g.304582 Transcript_108147/m.304582 type:complete len:221 (-) Transcript_108147:208-870(-)
MFAHRPSWAKKMKSSKAKEVTSTAKPSAEAPVDCQANREGSGLRRSSACPESGASRRVEFAVPWLKETDRGNFGNKQQEAERSAPTPLCEQEETDKGGDWNQQDLNGMPLTLEALNRECAHPKPTTPKRNAATRTKSIKAIMRYSLYWPSKLTNVFGSRSQTKSSEPRRDSDKSDTSEVWNVHGFDNKIEPPSRQEVEDIIRASRESKPKPGPAPSGDTE